MEDFTAEAVGAQQSGLGRSGSGERRVVAESGDGVAAEEERRRPSPVHLTHACQVLATDRVDLITWVIVT